MCRASFDATVRVWDVTKGTCLRVFEGHKEAIYSVSWSLNGMYLASGSFDNCINIWSLTGVIWNQKCIDDDRLEAW